MLCGRIVSQVALFFWLNWPRQCCFYISHQVWDPTPLHSLPPLISTKHGIFPHFKAGSMAHPHHLISTKFGRMTQSLSSYLYRAQQKGIVLFILYVLISTKAGRMEHPHPFISTKFGRPAQSVSPHLYQAYGTVPLPLISSKPSRMAQSPTHFCQDQANSIASPLLHTSERSAPAKVGAFFFFPVLPTPRVGDTRRRPWEFYFLERVVVSCIENPGFLSMFSRISFVHFFPTHEMQSTVSQT